MTADTVKPQLGLAEGRPFYRPQLGVDRDTIERAYRNLGFQNVSVISQLAFAGDRRAVTITWTIREGDQVIVDRVLINGHERISAELIRSELTIRPGSPMSDDAIIESQRRLLKLGLFDACGSRSCRAAVPRATCWSRSRPTPPRSTSAAVSRWGAS
jgi:outer membrane protein insertion porin family